MSPDNTGSDGAGGESTAPDADGQEADEGEATWEEVKRLENQKRQTTKEFVLEYPSGTVARFEYEMVESIDTIAEKYVVNKPTRSGSEPATTLPRENIWPFAAELFQEAIVSAPDGFKPTEQEIREGLTKEVVDEMVEAISEFSRMDEETFIKFR